MRSSPATRPATVVSTMRTKTHTADPLALRLRRCAPRPLSPTPRPAKTSTCRSAGPYGPVAVARISTARSLSRGLVLPARIRRSARGGTAGGGAADELVAEDRREWRAPARASACAAAPGRCHPGRPAATACADALERGQPLEVRAGQLALHRRGVRRLRQRGDRAWSHRERC